MRNISNTRNVNWELKYVVVHGFFYHGFLHHGGCGEVGKGLIMSPDFYTNYRILVYVLGSYSSDRLTDWHIPS